MNGYIFDSDEKNSLSTYIKEVEQIPLLSREEEYDLAVKAKNGDMVARNRIVEANSRFVISVAKSFQNRGLALEDLISEGNIGLLQAVDKFEPEKGYHFISYAVWWIRQSIMKAISDKSRMIRLPMNRENEYASLMKKKNMLEADGNAASLEEIAKECEMTQDEVKEILSYHHEVSSLDSPINDDENSTFGDMLESEIPGPEAQILESSLIEAIDGILNSLNERERDIIIRRYGLKNTKPLSLKEIGDLYGLTKERIRQIEKKVLLSLSQQKTVAGLKSYIA